MWACVAALQGSEEQGAAAGEQPGLKKMPTNSKPRPFVFCRERPGIWHVPYPHPHCLYF
jgi:hypothetical protein